MIVSAIFSNVLFESKPEVEPDTVVVPGGDKDSKLEKSKPETETETGDEKEKEKDQEPIDIKKGSFYYKDKGLKHYTRYLDIIGSKGMKTPTIEEKTVVDNITSGGREPYYLGDGSWIAVRATKDSNGFYRNCYLCGAKNEAVIDHGGEKRSICSDCFTD